MIVLPYREFKTANSHETIVLVHGGFSCGSEWDGVLTFLSKTSYHILIPDLPSHGAAVDIRPFLVDDAAEKLAYLIQTSAHNRTAHVVSISIGAHIAARLAARWHSLVTSLIVSGFNLYRPNAITPLIPPLAYMLQHGVGLLCSPAKEWQHIRAGQGSYAVTRDILNILISARELDPIAVRTLVVAATKKSLLPTDNIEHSRELFKRITPNNHSELMQHRKMPHPWNFEAPMEFADMVVRWISGQSLPEGLEALL